MIPYLIILTWQRIIYTLTDLLCNYSSISRHCCFSSVRRWFPDQRTNEQNKKSELPSKSQHWGRILQMFYTTLSILRGNHIFMQHCTREKTAQNRWLQICGAHVHYEFTMTKYQYCFRPYLHICCFFTVKLLWNTFGWLKQNYSW